VTEIIPGIRESDPTLFEIYGRVALTGQPERFEIFVQGLSMWFLISLYSPKREHFVAVFDAITERKQAERNIQALNATLERRVDERTAELVAANHELDAFAYAVSHDLRAPLRALRGFSQALIEDAGDQLSGEARDSLNEIMRAGRRMTDLIEGILTLSRSARTPLNRDGVDLSAIAQRLRRDFQRAEPHRQVTWEIQPGLTAHGDARMLEAVLENLLGNAWKYTATTRDARIHLYAEAADPPCWCVADNGAGFDMAHADRLFKPFQRLHRQDEFPGLGIGLATVQRMIRRHGGEITASAAPGQGALFRFTLGGTPPVPPAAAAVLPTTVAVRQTVED
jgi:signal transduction histidine kinase